MDYGTFFNTSKTWRLRGSMGRRLKRLLNIVEYWTHLPNIFNKKLPFGDILKQLQAITLLSTFEALQFSIVTFLELQANINGGLHNLHNRSNIQYTECLASLSTCWFEQRSPHGQVPRTHSTLSIRFRHPSPHPIRRSEGLQWQTMI